MIVDVVHRIMKLDDDNAKHGDCSSDLTKEDFTLIGR